MRPITDRPENYTRCYFDDEPVASDATMFCPDCLAFAASHCK
jgi:hypothetical protein